MIAHDYFAGASGWDIAAEALGWTVKGYENMEEARLTRAAAGLKTPETHDVTDVEAVHGEADMHLDSPPCQSFSMGGKGVGRRALDAVLAVVASYRWGQPMTYWEAAAMVGDDRTALVIEPLRLALQGRPMFIAWEQVPTVLPVWESCSDVLRRNGYSAVTGILNAEQYGVPQTRKRAILIARRDGVPAYLPTPTHSRYHNRDPKRLDPGVRKWVSNGTLYRARDLRDAREPALALTEKARSWQVYYRTSKMANATCREPDQPAPTIAFGRDAADVRPFLTLPPRLGHPGHRDRAGGERHHEKSVRITIEEASILQSFPADYPWQGSQTKRFLQIGNAIPPLLAHAILSTFHGDPGDPIQLGLF